jgi:hypothetical protein
MLNPWKNNRKRRPASAENPSIHFGRVRRLGFERVEGRLMLSGDAPHFISWDAYSTEFSIAIYQLGDAPVQLAPVEYVDGGFVQPRTVRLGPSTDGTFDIVTTGANSGVLGSGQTITAGFNLSDSSGVTFNFGGVHLDTPAIPVIVFPGTDSDAGTTFVDQPATAGPPPVEVTADEGGAIPINSILAFVGQTDNWKSGDRLASTASRTVRVNWGTPSPVRTPQGHEIMGEWARPAMLEMAGGEPASVGQPADARHERRSMFDEDDNLRLGRPRSFGAAGDTPADDSQAARDFDGSERSADSITPGEAASQTERLSATSQQPVSLAVASHVASDDSPAKPNSTMATESANRENDSASKLNAVNESAIAEVYDQLGTTEGVGAQAVFNREAWRDSWKATPLLMILALERIAASNSRRAKKELRHSAGQPQSHAPAPPDPA